jgi:hypothetical protein
MSVQNIAFFLVVGRQQKARQPSHNKLDNSTHKATATERATTTTSPACNLRKSNNNQQSSRPPSAKVRIKFYEARIQ